MSDLSRSGQQEGRKNTISTVLASREELTTVATVAILAALAIGVLAGVVVELGSEHQVSIGVIAIVVILAALGMLFWRVGKSLEFCDEIKAVLFFDGTTGALLPVQDYRFSSEIRSVVKAVEAESKSIHADWASHPLVEATPPVPKPKEKEEVWFAISKAPAQQPSPERVPAIEFIEEVTAFVLLEELSLHLSAHFTGSPEDEVVELQRSDIPEFLLKNRVLNLLSTPIEQRDVFLDAFPNANERPEGEIHMIFGSSGAMYRRFDLILPKRSKIQDIGRTGFSLDTKRFSLRVAIGYSGSSASFSPTFSRFYLNSDFRTTQSRTIGITVSGKIKLFALLNAAGWEYHTWLDSFRVRLSQTLDFEGFLDSIHWSLIEPLLYATRNPYERAPGTSPAEVKAQRNRVSTRDTRSKATKGRRST